VLDSPTRRIYRGEDMTTVVVRHYLGRSHHELFVAADRIQRGREWAVVYDADGDLVAEHE
jgi:hypothetical protein